jgi:hypothetical protein
MPDPVPTTRLCPAPDDRYTDPRSRRRDLVQMEEAGTFWLWAWPEILGWSVEITWLFSPVTGNDRWTGDLWGVDAAGELIIVETKSSITPGDPFKDFLQFERRRVDGARLPPTVEEIRMRWEARLRDERRFLKSNREALQVGSGQCIPGSGVVPYSCKRLVTWRWRGLYLDRIAPTVSSPAYEHSAVSGLERLRGLATWSPHYFALFTVLASAPPSFSKAGKASREALRDLVSPHHVHVRAIDCTGYVSPTQVAIACSHPNMSM